ncbi:DNA-binding IclR family transcriptional regulator [Rhodoligotrophos appendicifer]
MTVLSTLDYLGGARSRRLPEIITFLGRPKSTVLRLLETLVRSGFARRVGPGEYSVTVKLWRLGCQAINETDLKALILPAIRKMSMETEESGLYAVYEDGYSVFVEKIDSPQPVAASVTIGSRAPAYATATGKSMLAYQSTEEIERVLRAAQVCSPRTVIDYANLQIQLALVRERRLAFSSGEWREDIAGAAAPVFNRFGDVIGAIGISCPRSRMDQRMESLGRIVHTTAQELSASLGAPVSS